MPKRHASDRGLSSLRVTAKKIGRRLEVHASARRFLARMLRAYVESWISTSYFQRDEGPRTPAIDLI
jgi:hypothetical protein